MRTKHFKIIAATVTILGVPLWLYLHLHPSPPRVDRRPQEALGWKLAVEAAKRLGPGGRLTLIARDTSVYPNPAADHQLKGFHRALRDAKLIVASTNLVKFDPIRVVRVPPGDFLEMLRKQSDTNVIVSFLGPPVLTEEQLAKLGRNWPRIVAVCTGEMAAQVNLKEVFARKLIEVAIVSRPHPASAPPPSNRPEDWFEHYYQVLTSTNASDVTPHNESAGR